MPKQARILGYLGLIPFISLMIHTVLELTILNTVQASMAFVHYSAIILSFFGGVHWYQALTEPKNGHQIYIAMLPSVIGWVALLIFDQKITLFVLSVSYLLILMYDKYYLSLPKDMVINYTKMRLILTSVVIFTHVMMMLKH